MVRQKALEVFDGVMLADAGLGLHRREARFCITLCKGNKPALNRYLYYIKEALLAIGITVSSRSPNVFRGISKGREYEYCRLQSRISPLLTIQYHRWYRNHVKIVPDDIRITPISIAHWFMGDGSSLRDKRYRGACIDVSLSTYSFCAEDIKTLEKKLDGLGLSTGRRHYANIDTGDGIVITLHQASVNKFMDLISSYMMEPYLYKLKYKENAPFRWSPKSPQKAEV